MNVDLESGRIKLEFFLPANTNLEVRAVQKITNRLNEQYDGSTHSIARPPVFRGWYKDDDGNWIPDSVCLLWVVVSGDLETKDTQARLESVILMVDEHYKEANSPQEEIWMLSNTHNVFVLKNYLEASNS